MAAKKRRIPPDIIRELIPYGTPRHLAKAMGVDETTVRRWCREGAPMGRAAELAHALGTTVERLTGRAGVHADPDVAGEAPDIARLYEAMGPVERATLWRVACALYEAGTPVLPRPTACDAAEAERDAQDGPTADEVAEYEFEHDWVAMPPKHGNAAHVSTLCASSRKAD